MSKKIKNWRFEYEIKQLEKKEKILKKRALEYVSPQGIQELCKNINKLQALLDRAKQDLKDLQAGAYMSDEGKEPCKDTLLYEADLKQYAIDLYIQLLKENLSMMTIAQTYADKHDFLISSSCKDCSDECLCLARHSAEELGYEVDENEEDLMLDISEESDNE